MPELTRADVLETIMESFPIKSTEPAEDALPAFAGNPLVIATDAVGTNLVLFGPPGTGKSWQLNSRVAGGESLRVVFHPDYSYSDFLGSYRPVVGHEEAGEIVGYDGEKRYRPVSYFDFVPGIFLKAIVRAKEIFPQHVALIIEEMNRGDCAAIFGDLLQLLDRQENGESRYGVLPAPPVGRFLTNAKALPTPDSELRIPPNLSLFATINSSDQSLFPIDAAFKRRWRWEYVGTIDWPPELADARVEDPARPNGYEWMEVWTEVNRLIAEQHQVEDKSIGPWFLAVHNGTISLEEVRGKLLYYLWHDVFRESRKRVFAPDLESFGQLQVLYEEVGLAGILVESGLNE